MKFWTFRTGLHIREKSRHTGNVQKFILPLIYHHVTPTLRFRKERVITVKKTVQIMGIVAAIFLIIGFGLFILAGWGSLVEYHAFEWRGIDPAGASPLVMATNDLSILCAAIGLIFGITAIVLNAVKGSQEVRQTQKSQLN